ncbi:MAG: 2-oxo acid dehydrogenase subunit E2 [Pirellulales bacterium]|nr:2-oxo acid dehydrogenase subunit E2 [Pirellulales bacterium]
MTTQITLPNLGENIESGDVLSILVSEGDTIAVDQDIVEIETDKATMPVPSPEAGKVTKLLISEGDTIAVGAAILELEASETASAAAEAPPEPAPTPPAPEPEPAPAPPPVAEAPSPPPVAEAPPEPAPAAVIDTPGDRRSSAAAGPAVRRLARELGVDLRRVRPAGSDGRITEEDVRAHVRSSNEQAASSAPAGVTPPGTPDSDGQGAVRREKMSRMRQTIARNMFQSYSTIPQLTNFDDVDVTELERIRTDSKDDYAESGIKLTAMPFLIKAVASALKQHPIINASIDEEAGEIIYKEYVNVGIAVDTERGLVVPVLRDTDRKSIPQIARELATMADSVRSGSFGIDELRGGTFTISNLGAIGGAYSTPIINPPEVAILLVGRSRMMPQFIDGAFEPRLMMPLSLSYDHRIVDGAAAARFLNEVKSYLANPGRLLLAP